jgi:ABC-type Na+ efflux pump permease subunit
MMLTTLMCPLLLFLIVTDLAFVQLPLVQNDLNIAVYEMMLGVNSIRTAPVAIVGNDLPAGNNVAAAEHVGAASDDDNAVKADGKADAKKRKRAGKQGGVSLFPARYERAIPPYCRKFAVMMKLHYS